MSWLDGLLRYSLSTGGDQELHVISDPDNTLGTHVGNGIWTSAHELALLLAHFDHLTLGRCVLELGSGLGFVGQVRTSVYHLTQVAGQAACSVSAAGHKCRKHRSRVTRI